MRLRLRLSPSAYAAVKRADHGYGIGMEVPSETIDPDRRRNRLIFGLAARVR
jgi:hypothetical protein